MMKTIFLIVGCLSYKAQTMEKPATSLITITHQVPALNVYDLSIENPEILPAVMLTCKEWNEKNQLLWKGLTSVYSILSSSISSEFRDIFNSSSKNTRINMNSDDFFRLVFIKIIFGRENRNFVQYRKPTLNSKNALDDMLNSVDSSIRKYVQQHVKFPHGLKKKYSLKFHCPDTSLKFSYLQTFELRLKVQRFNNLGDVSTLREFLDLVCEIDEKKGNFPKVATWYSFLSFTDSSITDSSNNFLLKPYREPLMTLYKLILVEKNLSGQFFDNDKTILPYEHKQMMRRIPVNFATLGDDIQYLKKKVDNDIVQLEAQWEKVVQRSYNDYNQLQHYLQIG